MTSARTIGGMGGGGKKKTGKFGNGQNKKPAREVFGECPI